MGLGGRDRHACVELDRPRARDAGRVLGRLAVLRARLGVDRQPQPEHVHADRARRRRGLRLQRRRRRSRPASFPKASACTAVVETVLRHRGRHHRAGAARPGARAARARAGPARRSAQLLGLAPKTARVVRDGAKSDVPLADVQVGDILRVRPGEKVPVDGVVVEGQQRRRRIDGDRRADAGREGSRRARDRRHDQRHRHAR